MITYNMINTILTDLNRKLIWLCWQMLKNLLRNPTPFIYNLKSPQDIRIGYFEDIGGYSECQGKPMENI